MNSELYYNYIKEEYIDESNNKLLYYLIDKKNENEIKFPELKSGSNIEVTIESIENEYISSKDKDNNEIYISCNLYDFNYKHSDFNLQELSIGQKINIKIKSIEKDGEFFTFGEMPDVLINKLIQKGEELRPEFESEGINIGDEVLCRITSVKEKYIYTLIKNKYIGRMDIENYQGNLEKIKKLIKETVGIRKMSVESRGSTDNDLTNNYPKELLINSVIIDIIKLHNRLNSSEVGVNKKKKN
jgi:hypothetical protein